MKIKAFLPVLNLVRGVIKCNVAIYFTSKEAETPSGKPTKNPLTGKIIPLDPSTSEYHECKPEDIEAYRATDEHKKKIEEWLSTQKSGQEVVGSSNSYTSASNDTSSSHDATNKNNSMSLTLEKIMTGINHINAFLEQMHTDFKAEIARH